MAFLARNMSQHEFSSWEGEMRKCHLDMIVLAALASGPAHGYAVIQEIRHRNGDAFDLPEGAIYPALYRLEQRGLLNGRWTAAGSGRQRCVYSLTHSGRRALADPRTSLRRLADTIGSVFGEGSYATVSMGR
jgi:PadR family transcriptional regulator PadR